MRHQGTRARAIGEPDDDDITTGDPIEGRSTVVPDSDLAAIRAELEALADDVQCIDPEELQYGHVAWVAGCIRAVAAKL